MIHWSYCIASALLGAGFMLFFIACADVAKTADQNTQKKGPSHV